MRGEKTGGRQKGTPNKSTAEVKALAQEHGPAAIAFFTTTMNDEAQPIQARHLAAKELLDRGYGRPSQELSVQVQQATNTPEYFAWVPRDRLHLMLQWMAEAKAAMVRGDPRPGDPLPLPAVSEGVVVVEETPSETETHLE